MIPISVPFLWLLFPFNRRLHLYDHTVFVTYSVSFMLVLVTAAVALVRWLGAGWLATGLLLYVPFHMYRQLRGCYALSRIGAIWRTFLLSLFALVVVMLFATIMTLLLAA